MENPEKIAKKICNKYNDKIGNIHIAKQCAILEVKAVMDELNRAVASRSVYNKQQEILAELQKL